MECWTGAQPAPVIFSGALRGAVFKSVPVTSPAPSCSYAYHPQVQALQHANQQIGVLELKLQETSSEQMTRSSEAQEVQHLSVKLAEKEATLKDLQVCANLFLHC